MSIIFTVELFIKAKIVVTLSLFFPMFPFDPLENIRKPLVFRCFQGDQKETLGRKGLMRTFNSGYFLKVH